MTDQIPEYLDNQCPDVEFGDLELRQVATGGISTNNEWGTDYPFKSQPGDFGVDCCTDLYRGYIAEFVLTTAGELFLKGYDYPNVRPKVHTDVCEKIEGDFWLVMDSEFGGPCVYVPFRNGTIVADEGQWITEEGCSVTSLKFPERIVWHWKDLAEPVFLGIVKSVEADRHEPEQLRFVSDREFAHKFYYCQVRFVRDGQVLCELRIEGNSGNGAGPWILTPKGASICAGDELWATAQELGKKVAEGVPR